MSKQKTDEIQFEGEEAGSGYASPALDLLATAFLIVLSLAVMAGALALPVPGEWTTAPGLMPFLVAASLMAMAVGLGASAVMRRRAGVRGRLLEGRDLATDGKSIILAGAVAIYIAALQVLSFRTDIVFAGIRHTISAFEPVTMIALAAIIVTSWRGPIWIAASISIAWTLTLSIVFQHVFTIPLPGSF